MNGRIWSSLLSARKICDTFISHKNRSVTYSLLKQTRLFSITNQNKNLKNESEKDIVENVTTKHNIFRDEDSSIILDAEEERDKILLDDLHRETIKYDPYHGLNLKRGVHGVYDIEDLISVLQKDNARDIFAASVPAEYAYVDYIVIVTAKSYKHMSALAEYVRKVFKLKMHKTDIIPKIEGPGSKDWIALDLGNIALHIFSAEAREHYDLETLWTVGSNYDDKSQKQEEDIMEQYNAFLKEFHPAEP